MWKLERKGKITKYWMSQEWKELFRWNITFFEPVDHNLNINDFFFESLGLYVSHQSNIIKCFEVQGMFINHQISLEYQSDIINFFWTSGNVSQPLNKPSCLFESVEICVVNQSNIIRFLNTACQPSIKISVKDH